MRIPFMPRTISAALLYAYATDRLRDRPANDETASKTLLLVSDLFLKARSYAWINKSAFWASLVLSVATLLWPAFSILAVKGTTLAAFVQSPIAQASVTALAALAIALYTNYKGKENTMETLMRRVIFAKPEDIDAQIKLAVDGIETADMGFSFAGLSAQGGQVPQNVRRTT